MGQVTVVLLVAGAMGGLVRGVVGFIKHQFAYKNVDFKPWYMASMISLSALVGLTVTWAVVYSGLEIVAIVEVNPAIAFIVGYAGGDIIENLYKILAGKATIFPVSPK